MTFDDSDESDSDYEELEVPYEPPQRPPALVSYYIEQNRDTNLNENDLRTQWKEGIGQKEKQKYKKAHKKLLKRYEKLLKLYSKHNPDFNFEEWNKSNSSKSPYTKKTQSGLNNNGNKKNKRNKRSRQHYMIDSSSSNNNYVTQPQRKKHKRNRGNNFNGSGNNIDELFKGINSTTRKRKDVDAFNPEDDQKIQMTQLVNNMRTAARNDWECNKNKQPAINTTKMLEIVVTELSKKLFYKHYLDDTEILEALRDWIHPLPDGSLPSLRIRTELYRIIEKFGLHEYESQSLEHYLLMSEQKSKDPRFKQDIHPSLKSFGKTLMNLWAHKKETTSNKNRLRKIIERWIRTLTNTDSSYGELREAMKESSMTIKRRYKILQKQQKDFNFGKKKRAQIPEKAWHDFAIAPDSIIDEDHLKELTKTQNRYNRNTFSDKMNKASKRNNTAKQAAVPSVTGKHRM